eukprot:scaffold329671_cov64-Tisochrysis_lutea.AAC.1
MLPEGFKLRSLKSGRHVLHMWRTNMLCKELHLIEFNHIVQPAPSAEHRASAGGLWRGDTRQHLAHPCSGAHEYRVWQ